MSLKGYINSSQTESQIDNNKWMSDLADQLHLIVLPFIIIVGSVFNVLAFLVMRRIRYSATSYYMAILGLVDFGALVSGGCSLWLVSFHGTWSTFLISDTWCKLIPFVFYTFLDLSVCLVVIMTGERLFAVSKPLHANYFLKKKKSCTIILVAALASATLNSHFLYTLSLESSEETFNGNGTLISHKNCVPVRWLYFYEKIWIYVDATIYSFLPIFLLCIFNFTIVRYLIKAAEKRHLKLQCNTKNLVGTCISFQGKQNSSNGDRCSGVKISYQMTAPHETIKKKHQIDSIQLNETQSSFKRKTNHSFNHSNQTTYNGVNKRLTLMLFIINVFFCLFSMPIALCQILFDNKSLEIPKFQLLKAIAELLQYLNHGSNFFLYILSGKTFRMETKYFILHYFGCYSAKKIMKIRKKRPVYI